MKYLFALLCLSVPVCLAQTPPPTVPPTPKQSTAVPNASQQPAAQPHVELSVEPAPEHKAPVPPDTVVLSVGDFKLTAAQFDLLIDMLPEQSKAFARGPGRKQFGDQLAKTLVLAQEARRQKLDGTPTFQIQSTMQVDNVLANLMFQDLIKGVKVDDAALHKYYDDHKAQFEQIRARHILIRFQGSPLPVKPGQKDLTPDEALAKAQELEKRIVAGEDFAKIAAAESDDSSNAAKGGDLGFFGHGRMVPSFEQAAFKLTPGQVSDPVKSNFGYHIIKVEEVKPFDDLKADVEKAMAPEQARQQLDDLQKKSAVVYNTEFFNMAKQ